MSRILGSLPLVDFKTISHILSVVTVASKEITFVYRSPWSPESVREKHTSFPELKLEANFRQMFSV